MYGEQAANPDELARSGRHSSPERLGIELAWRCRARACTHVESLCGVGQLDAGPAELLEQPEVESLRVLQVVPQ